MSPEAILEGETFVEHLQRPQDGNPPLLKGTDTKLNHAQRKHLVKKFEEQLLFVASKLGDTIDIPKELKHCDPCPESGINKGGVNT